MSTSLDILKTELSPACWTEDPDRIAPHLVEWRDKYQGRTPLMLFPDSTETVSKIVRICHEHDINIVPQGGNTGLVGSQIPDGEVLLSTIRLNRVRSVCPINNALTVEAGVTLMDAQKAAENEGRKFPLSLASEGTCTIGGNLSTNAGGVHVLKYGTTKDLVFGVEAVLPNGDIFDGLSNLRKDNTGYDLSRLFLGAEGTLGVITAASLKLFPRPGHIQRAMMGTKNPATAIALLDHCRAADHLAMFEVIPAIGLDLVTRHIPGMRNPFSTPQAWYVLVDWEVENEIQGWNLAESKLASAFEENLITDGVIAQSGRQATDLLALRENMSAAQKFNGGSIKLDITVPLDRIPEFFEVADKAVQKCVPGCRPVGFGHFGDGNIHYNIAQPEDMAKEAFLEKWQDISDCVFDIVDALKGSISAEHGIGVMKRKDLAQRADPVKLELMRTLKMTLDPKRIMNPRSLI